MKQGIPSIVICALVTLLCAPSISAQSIGARGHQKENLDLPFDAVGEDGPDEEVAEIVIIYNHQYEGDGFFFVVDRSGTMQDRDELPRAKRELRRIVTEMSAYTEFGIVFFDSGLLRFPVSGRAKKASATWKRAAAAWITTVGGGTGSCCREGLLAGLQFANSASARRKTLVYIGDGGGTCRGANESTYLENTLEVVRQRNSSRAQINTIGVIMGTNRAMQERFLRQLASQTGGNYRRLN
jgi:hypothetical protein